MARALLGYVGNVNEQVLVLEIARLRRRVAELEDEVGELRAAAGSAALDPADLDHAALDPAALDPAVLDLELHRMAEPALT